MDASLIDYDWDLDGVPGVNRKHEEDKVIVDMAQLADADSPSARALTARVDETRPVFARGTRDRVPVPHNTAAGVARGPAPREMERDPVAVLRTWPHSKTSHGEPGERPRTAMAPLQAQRRVEDKIVLAHLALDLFREIEQLQTIVERAQGAAPCEPRHAACIDPQCAAKADVLRGALVEACLMVQRVAMMAPTECVDIEDRIHDLLEILQR
jgi:hypothetical protein